MDRSVPTFFNYLKNWFYTGNPKKPVALRNRTFQLITALDITDTVVKSPLWSRNRLLATSIALSKNYSVRRAPRAKYMQIIELAKYLWLKQKPTYKNSLIKRRRASTMLILALVSGSRWIDVSRLFWDDLIAVVQPNYTVIMFPMRILKSDPWSKADDLRTFARVKNNYWACPVAAISRFWMFMGRPSKGPVFPCV